MITVLLIEGAIDPMAWTMGECSVFTSREPMGFQTSIIERPPPQPYRWHMSIAHPERYPTWDEMVHAREYLLPLELVFAQIFPADWDEYVNIHPNCFHLWEVRDESG